MNKKKSLCVLLLTPLLAFVACGSDSNESGSSNTANVNVNSTDKSQYATRMEMPKLEQGNNYLLLVKTDPDIGVNYTIEWNCEKRAQCWTCWEWTKENNYKNWVRSNWKNGYTLNGYGGNYDPFQPDPDFPEAKKQCRTEFSDYSGTGYTRGHMCASEDRICNQNVNGQTFYLSNMQPQTSEFNGGIWEKMETKVRTWCKTITNGGGTAYVCKGGTINNVTLDGKSVSGTITDSKMKIPVPKYFFMAIVTKTDARIYSGMAFWAEQDITNSTDDLTKYMITIDELEKRTGFDFFCNLPDDIENSVEHRLSTSEWQ